MSLSTHQRLVRAAREVSRAVRAVSAAERYMDGATLEFPRAYLKQLAADLGKVRELLMHEATRPPAD